MSVDLATTAEIRREISRVQHLAHGSTRLNAEQIHIVNASLSRLAHWAKDEDTVSRETVQQLAVEWAEFIDKVRLFMNATAYYAFHFEYRCFLVSITIRKSLGEQSAVYEQSALAPANFRTPSACLKTLWKWNQSPLSMILRPTRFIELTPDTASRYLPSKPCWLNTLSKLQSESYK
jgi:hypothetical protein